MPCRQLDWRLKAARRKKTRPWKLGTARKNFYVKRLKSDLVTFQINLKKIMVLLNPREGRGKENGLGIAFILPATGSESTRQTTLREGEAGGKHCNVFFNSPHESWFHGPLWFYKLDKDKRKKMHHWDRTHKTFTNPFPPTPTNTGFTSPRHWLYQVTLTASASNSILSHCKAWLAPSPPLSTPLATDVQTEVICGTGQICKASAQELVPLLVLPSCPLRGLAHKSGVLPEAGAIYM